MIRLHHIVSPILTTDLHSRAVSSPPFLYTFLSLVYIMVRTFSPVVDIQTRQMQWAMYKNFEYVGVASAVEISAHFRDKYSFEMEEWRKAHK